MGLLRHRRYASLRRMLVAAALGGFLAATVGIPVVVPSRNGKDRSQPYPCMDHACGCHSAEACWRQCCCFTNQEKLAWAAEHHVRPPGYVFAAAAKEKAVASHSSCCQREHDSCCEERESCCEEDHVAASDAWSIEFVSAIQARRCQGQAELWLALGDVMPPPAKMDVVVELWRGDVVVVAADARAGISHQPAAPPPRV